MVEGRSPLPAFLSAAILAALAAAGIAARPLLPIDETRYLSVAWEMWQRGDWLVPHLNGEPYHHKPPLLFWLILLGWKVGGVGETWPRLIQPLFALATVSLLPALARRLWPERPEAGRLAPLVLAGSFGLLMYFSLVGFDILLAFAILTALLGVLTAWRKGGRSGWLLAGLGLGLGVLAKGPVVLVHVLPAPLLAPLWMGATRPTGWRAWYGGLLLAAAMGAAIGLAWAVPAAVAGGEAFARAIFWGQSAGRMVQSFEHAAPWWWYLPVLPALLFPWVLWPPLWRAVRRLPAALRADAGARLCLLWLVAVVAVFSVISGKRPHYLLPVLPAFALLAGRLLAEGGAPAGRRDPWWLAAPVGALAVLALVAGLVPPEWAARLLRRLPEGSLPDLTVVGGLVGAVAAGLLLVRPPAGVAASAARAAAAAALVLVAAQVEFRLSLAGAFDLAPLSRYVAAAQAGGRPLVHLYTYEGQFHYLGRLDRPLDDRPREGLLGWAEAHPDGGIIMIVKEIPEPPPVPLDFVQRYRAKYYVVIPASALVADRGSGLGRLR